MPAYPRARGPSSSVSLVAAMEDRTIHCLEWSRSVDEFAAIAQRRSYWSDGCAELPLYCPECARTKFTPVAIGSSDEQRAARRLDDG
jgi:hypothetical protein